VFARVALALAVSLALAAPAGAQIPLIIPIPAKKKPKEAGPPPNAPPSEAEIWPYPAPDPKTWWEDKRPKVEEAADPLGGRRVRRGERLPTPDSGVDASTYRLWGLMPLQWELLRGDEMILEVWTRPTNSVRQSVTRVVVRGDGKAFVQGRAGLACCEAGISRRVGFDAELPAGSAERFRALAKDPVWASPRDVTVAEAGAAEGVCVEGSSFDLPLLLPGARSRPVHRACDSAAIGQAADVLETVLGAALGHDPRFDVVFRGNASFAAARADYRALIASGGRLKPSTGRGAPPGLEPRPPAEADASAVEPEPARPPASPPPSRP
jgi:hypothetical protein